MVENRSETFETMKGGDSKCLQGHPPEGHDVDELCESVKCLAVGSGKCCAETMKDGHSECLQGHRPEGHDVDELCESVKCLTVGSGKCGAEGSDPECFPESVTAKLDAESEVTVCAKCVEKDETEINGLVEGVTCLGLVEKGLDGKKKGSTPSEGDHESKIPRYPEEGSVTDSEESEGEISINVNDVKGYIRVIDESPDFRDGHQIAQIGAKPCSEFDKSVLPNRNPARNEIVAHIPPEGIPTEKRGSDDYRRKGWKMNMAGGGIVGGDENVNKVMRPMLGPGDFHTRETSSYTTSSRSGMTGGSMAQGLGQGYPFPEIKDPLAVPGDMGVRCNQSATLPSISSVLNPSFGVNQQMFPSPPKPYGLPHPESITQQQQQLPSQKIHQIEDYLKAAEDKCAYDSAVSSPYSGSSGIGSPHDSLGVASPGSIHSESSNRLSKFSESEDEGYLTTSTYISQDESNAALDDIAEVIQGEMPEMDMPGKKDPVHAAPPPPIPPVTQGSALLSQLGQPPMCSPPYLQQNRTQVPQTTGIITTTASMQTPVIILLQAQVKKGPVPILPKPNGAPSTNTATVPSKQRPKKRAQKKSKNSKSSESSTSPSSRSPITGRDSVFFPHSPDMPEGFSSDASMTSCIPSPGSVSQMSPMSTGSHGAPSPSGAGIQDGQLGSTIPSMVSQGVSSVTPQQGPMTLQTTMSQCMVTCSNSARMTHSQGVPSSLPFGTSPASNAMAMSRFAMNTAPPQMSVMSEQMKPNATDGFQKPVAAPPHPKKNARPDLKIDTKFAASGSLGHGEPGICPELSLTPIPASPSTPTTMSKKSRAFSVINLLTEEQFQVIDEDGDSLVHRFILHGEIYMTEAFLARCKRQGCLANFINLQNYDGQTPLYLAIFACRDCESEAIKNYTEIVKTLLEFGADPTIKDKRYSSALHCASKQYLNRILDLLLTMPPKKLDLSVRDCDGMTPLLIAIQNHDLTQKRDCLPTVELLLQHGANPQDKARKDGRNALHFAIEQRSPEIMEKVLKYGNASHGLVTDATDSGNTGLHIVAGLPMDDIKTKVQMVQLLLRSGANRQGRNLEQKTPKDLVYDPKSTGQIIVDMLKIRHSSSQSSNPASPAQCSGNVNQSSAPKSDGQFQSETTEQVIQAGNPEPSMANGIPWGNTMSGYEQQSQEPSESFLDQLCRQGPCETSDDSLGLISSTLTDIGLATCMGQTSVQTGVGQYSGPAFSAPLNADLFCEQDGITSCTDQLYSHLNSQRQQPVMSTLQQSYSQATTSAVNQHYFQGAAGVNQIYSQAGSAGVNQTYSQAGTAGVNQTYSQAGTAGVNQTYSQAGTAGVNQIYSQAGTAGVNQTYSQAGSAGVNQTYSLAGSAGVNQTYSQMHQAYSQVGPTRPSQMYSQTTTAGSNQIYSQRATGVNQAYSQAGATGVNQTYLQTTMPGNQTYSQTVSGASNQTYSHATMPGNQTYPQTTMPGNQTYSQATMPGNQTYSQVTMPGNQTYSQNMSNSQRPGSHQANLPQPGMNQYLHQPANPMATANQRQNLPPTNVAQRFPNNGYTPEGMMPRQTVAGNHGNQLRQNQPQDPQIPPSTSSWSTGLY